MLAADIFTWKYNAISYWKSSRRKGADLLTVVCRTHTDAPPESGISVIAVSGPAEGIVLERAIDSVGHRAHLQPQFRLNDVHTPADRLIGPRGPLTWAAECHGLREPSKARLDIAEWFIDNGFDVHEGGDAPLMRASLNAARTSMMGLLVRHGADVNAAWHGVYPVVFAPCETLDPIALDWLLRHDADPILWRSFGVAVEGNVSSWDCA